MKKKLNISCITKQNRSMNIPEIGDMIKIKLPSRIHMSLLNDNRISLGLPGGGGLVMAIDGFNTDITMKVIEGNTSSVLSGNSDLVNHITNLFCAACSVKKGYQ